MSPEDVRYVSDAEAYDSMYLFLERYYAETKAEEVGIILGELRLIGPRKSADPGAWPVWLKCLDDILAKRRRADS